LKQRPDIYALNADLAGVNWYRNHLDELKTVDAANTKHL
ncbi:MAG: acylneuraminate cytidylyltransferase, partial [Hymenobacter sp.]